MLFQPSDLLPLDPGYFPVPVHVPDNADVSHQELQDCIYIYIYTLEANGGGKKESLITLPIHVEHRGELELVVNLLRTSECLVELKS